MSGLTHAFLVAILLMGTTEAARILVIHAFPGRSHVVAYAPLHQELARKGHEVTVISAFPTNKKIPNYIEITVEDTFPPKDSSEVNFFEMRRVPWFLLMFFMKEIIINSCEKFLEQPGAQNLIHSTDLQFDLILYEPFMTQCAYGFFHKYNATTIQIIPNTLIEWNNDPAGNPNTIAYVPSLFSDGEDMGFLSRLSSFALNIYMKLFNEIFIVPRMESIMRKHFTDPTLPTTHELERKASFVFLHSHPLIHHPRPLTPNTIEVGGLHLKGPQELPQDLKKFLDDAPQGVIYFSLGSNVRSVDMPETMRNAILKSFSKLKQKVLWKWENDTLPGQPKNVKLGKWFPQQPILAHPNVKMFITHGGLMSLEEFTYFGVPVIAIPVSADQEFNADVARNRGFGVVLKIKNITEESLDWALHEVLEEPRYREAVQRASRIFRDQPQTPLERAVFWVEFALRHQGAPHLRSAALDLNVFQYHLLDVLLALAAFGLLSVALAAMVLRRVARRLFSKGPKKESSQKKRK